MRIDRRTALSGIATATAGVAFGTGATGIGPRDPEQPLLGHWLTDPYGLPCYAFTGDVPVVTSTPAGRNFPLETDPVFLLGNYDLTLFATASGRLLFVSGERGWVRLNEPTAGIAGHRATLTVSRGGATRTHELLGPGGVCASPRDATRVFGCGAARYRMTPQPGLTVDRVLSVAPSTAERRAQPAVVISVQMTNTGTIPLDVEHIETVLANPTLLPTASPPGREKPVRFINTAHLLPDAAGVVCDASATSDQAGVLAPPDAPSPYNLYPPSLVLASAPHAGGEPVVFGHHVVADGVVALTARSRVRLEPGATRTVVLVIALKSQEEDLGALQRFAASLGPSATGDWFRAAWADVLAPLATVPDPELRAELLWNGHALLAMATYAAYCGQTFIPQGTTYDYVLDLNSGPRDHLQHVLGVVCFAPELARSAILYTLCQMTREGGIKFTVSGNGHTAGSTWSPSDQSLFLFYALGEYLRITNDWSIMEAATPYAPAPSGATGTVLEKLERAFIHLRDHVSIGPHGLVRLMTGDWNDQIYAGLPTGLYRETAESHMNSAMVMAIVPSLAGQLAAYAKMLPPGRQAAVERLATDMRDYAARISLAMMRDMESRTFARRAWLAPGRALGDDDMYLEPQSFLLQAAAFPVARKRTLLREMRRRLMDGEALGPRQCEKPAGIDRMLPGTGENGGFWYSLAGQAIVGMATFDRSAALALLDRMTFRSFGRRYPGYWVGQWSAPDTLNAAPAGDIAGLPRPMDSGIYLKMASYCAHAHAWPIYCYFKIKEEKR